MHTNFICKVMLHIFIRKNVQMKIDYSFIKH